MFGHQRWKQLLHKLNGPSLIYPSTCIPRPQINLVPYKYATEPIDFAIRDGCSLLELAPPFSKSIKRLRLVHVEHEQHRISASKKGR